jgi:hypothetical protein
MASSIKPLLQSEPENLNTSMVIIGNLAALSSSNWLIGTNPSASMSHKDRKLNKCSNGHSMSVRQII